MEINYCKEGRCECLFGEHIFSELYTVPEKIRLGYIRVKILELLLVMTEYFSEHHTIEELAERFEMSPTVLKKCFRGVYGDSIYSYRKLYRLQ